MITPDVPSNPVCDTCDHQYTPDKAVSPERCASVEHYCGNCKRFTFTCAECIEKFFSSQQPERLRTHDVLYPKCVLAVERWRKYISLIEDHIAGGYFPHKCQLCKHAEELGYIGAGIGWKKPPEPEEGT